MYEVMADPFEGHYTSCAPSNSGRRQITFMSALGGHTVRAATAAKAARTSLHGIDELLRGYHPTPERARLTLNGGDGTNMNEPRPAHSISP